MQQNYYLSFETEGIRLALDAARRRQGIRHQQTLERLKLFARVINL